MITTRSKRLPIVWTKISICTKVWKRTGLLLLLLLLHAYNLFSLSYFAAFYNSSRDGSSFFAPSSSNRIDCRLRAPQRRNRVNSLFLKRSDKFDSRVIFFSLPTRRRYSFQYQTTRDYLDLTSLQFAFSWFENYISISGSIYLSNRSTIQCCHGAERCRISR